jgi:hypothetical protein
MVETESYDAKLSYNVIIYLQTWWMEVNNNGDLRISYVISTWHFSSQTFMILCKGAKLEFDYNKIAQTFFFLYKLRNTVHGTCCWHSST